MLPLVACEPLSLSLGFLHTVKPRECFGLERKRSLLEGLREDGSAFGLA